MGNSITLYTRNVLETAAAVTGSGADTGYPRSRLYDRSQALLWKYTTASAVEIAKADQGATGILAVDFLAVPAHNLAGLTVNWEYSDNDADFYSIVTGWSQADNSQIIKVAPAPVTHRYLKVYTGTPTESATYASELFLSLGREFTVQQEPAPAVGDRDNVRWDMTMGGSERATKFGDARRERQFNLWLDSSDHAAFRAAMAELNEYSRPFYLRDLEDNYWLCRLLEIPAEQYDAPKTRVTLHVIEVL
jgi:hypothetical protein